MNHGTKKRILLSSVPGPYAEDGEYSRKVNPMSLMLNQVTRGQGHVGEFTPHQGCRSNGLIMIAENIDADVTILDFPRDFDAFEKEIRSHHYDIIGITSIYPNLRKAGVMSKLIRRHSPHSVIVLGGHGANAAIATTLVDADHYVKGDGIAWFREYLGQNVNTSLRHPVIQSSFGLRIMGVPIPDFLYKYMRSGDLIPSVGCPKGCEFCSTSAMFGGKGKNIEFFRTGDELFEICCNIEARLGVSSFRFLEENFLLNYEDSSKPSPKIMRLLDLIEQYDKVWSFSGLASADAILSYDLEALIRLGLSAVWIGLEGKDNHYEKLRGVNTVEFVRELQSHGIAVLGSTIIGFPHHTPENISAVVDYAIEHNTNLHQFMLYTPIPGTPLYQAYEKKGLIIQERLLEDINGQVMFNYRHQNIPESMSAEIMNEAFRREFEANGPSISYRLPRVLLDGYRRHGKGAERNERVRRRLRRSAVPILPTFLAAAVYATKLWYEKEGKCDWVSRCEELHRELRSEFGSITLASPYLGRVLHWTLRREERRMRNGWTWEPGAFRDHQVRVYKGSGSKRMIPFLGI